MGTRCMTRVFQGDEEVVSIYRHWDGYPDCHGKNLAALLADKTCVNGFSSAAKTPEKLRLNGPGRVASFIVANLWENGHQPDIIPHGADAGVAYEYHVKCPTYEMLEAAKNVGNYDGLPIIIEAFEVSGGYDDVPRTLNRVTVDGESPSESDPR
jgi:hypothetical protein